MDDEVWAKHRNKRYYRGTIIRTKIQHDYSAYFPSDGTFCYNLMLHDFINWDWTVEPVIGEKVKVQWIDGNVYDARYMGKNSYNLFTVIGFLFIFITEQNLN